MADYKNNMVVNLSILPPPTKTLYYYPVKDVYIDQSKPVRTFNIENMFIKSSTGGNYTAKKVLMTFDVPKIDKNQFDNIVSVQLRLHSDKNNSRDANLQLKYHTDNGWDENGVTWMGQPIDDSEVLATTTYSLNQEDIVFDITDEYKKANNKGYAPAFTILEDSVDGEEANNIIVYSSESTYKPAIAITYKYFPENYDYGDLKGQLTVRYTRPNYPVDPPDPSNPPKPGEEVTYPDLPGKINIWGGTTKDDLNGQITVKTYDGTPGELPGQLKVRWTVDMVDPKGQLTVQRKITNGTDSAYELSKPDLKGQIDTHLFVANGIDPSPADPRYLTRKPPADLNGQIMTHIYDGDPLELPGKFITQRVIDKGVDSIYADSKPDLNGQLNIPIYNEVGDLNSQLTIRHIVPNDNEPSPDLPGQLTINLYHENTDLNGSITVRYSVPNDNEPSPDLPGQLTINLYHENTDLNGSITVRYSVPNDNEPAPDLPGQLSINQYNGENNLDGKLFVKFNEDLKGQVSVATYYDKSDMNGQINIIGYGTDDLNGKLNIIGSKSIDGQMVVRSNNDSDLVGKLFIARNSNQPYAFIM